MINLKAAGSELDWPVNYTLEAGETLSASGWAIVPVETGGLAVKGGSASFTDAAAACIFTGGVFGRVYEATNTVTTSQGRVYATTLAFRIGPVEAT